MNIEDDELPIDLELGYESISFIPKINIKDNKDFNFFKSIKNYTYNLLFNTCFYFIICLCNFVCCPIACFYHFCTNKN